MTGVTKDTHQYQINNNGWVTVGESFVVKANGGDTIKFRVAETDTHKAGKATVGIEVEKKIELSYSNGITFTSNYVLDIGEAETEVDIVSVIEDPAAANVGNLTLWVDGSITKTTINEMKVKILEERLIIDPRGRDAEIFIINVKDGENSTSTIKLSVSETGHISEVGE